MLSQPLILTMANGVDALKAHNTWNKHQYITWRRRVALGNPLAVRGNPTDDAVSAYPELAWAVFVSISKSPRSYTVVYHFTSIHQVSPLQQFIVLFQKNYQKSM